MATNIELNYYNGNQYEVLYPYVNLSNSTGNLSSSRISGNINAYTLGGYTYSQVVSIAKKSKNGSYRGNSSFGINNKNDLIFNEDTVCLINSSAYSGALMIWCRGNYAISFLMNATSDDSQPYLLRVILPYNNYYQIQWYYSGNSSPGNQIQLNGSQDYNYIYFYQ